MKKTPLLPRYFRWIGLLLILFSFLIYLNGILEILPFSSLDIYVQSLNLMNISLEKEVEDFHFGLHSINLGYVLIIIPSLVGLTFLAFSKSNFLEDEFINNLRLRSWSISIVILIVYNLLINIFTWGTLNLTFAVLGPHFLLLCFVLIFRLKLFTINRRLGNEE